MISKLTALPAPGGATAAVVPAAEPAAATEGEPGTAPADRAIVATRSPSAHPATVSRRAAAVDYTGESGTSRSSVPRGPVCSAPASRRSAARAVSSRARWAPPCHRPAA